MKTCIKCKIEKPFEAFSKNKNSKDGHAYECKECMKARAKRLKQDPLMQLEKQIRSSVKLENRLLKREGKKLCAACKRVFLIEDLSSEIICKECSRIRYKEYYKKNKEKINEKVKEYHKEYCKENKEKIREYQEKNKEKIREYRKKYNQKNKEKINEKNKEYRDKNKEKAKEYRKEYYEKNKDICSKKGKEYRQKNKKIIKERNRQYYLKKKLKKLQNNDTQT